MGARQTIACDHSKIMPVEIDPRTYDNDFRTFQIAIAKCTKCECEMIAIRYTNKITGYSGGWKLQHLNYNCCNYHHESNKK